MLSRAEERVFRILDTKGDTQAKNIGDIIVSCFSRLDTRMQHKHAFGGIETGFHDYDDKTGGLQNGELTILAARPSMGKTALALNIVEYIGVELRKPTLVISLEMASLELGDRLLCARAPRQRPQNAQRPHLRARSPCTAKGGWRDPLRADLHR